MSMKFGMAMLLFLTISVSLVSGQTFRDDFDVNHDYSTGAVAGGGIWTGVHNPTAGGLTFDANVTTPGSLFLGSSGVGWGGGGGDNAPSLYREVDADQLREVRMRISAQTVGTWSMAGSIIRKPGPIDGVGANDNFATYASFRVGVDDTGAALGVNGMSATTQNVTNGGEAENNSTALNLIEADLEFLRIVHLGTGDFQTYASQDGVNWGEPIQTITNGALSQGNVEVGLWGGTFGELADAMASFDWVEIELGDDAPEDMAIWDTAATVADWNRSVWVDEADNGLGVKPNSNISVAVFGDVLDDMAANVRLDPSTVYTNSNVTAKELRFDTAIAYTIGGAGSITLASDTGTALVTVNAGSHEIQTDLVLADNTNATAAAGAVLDINASVDLAGNTLTLAGAGDVNLNNGVIFGGGQLIGAGSLVGLGGVVGDLVQPDTGSLAVAVGGAAINITGSAELAGTLDVSLAEGFAPTPGEMYTILTAGSLTDAGVSLGDGANLFQLVVGENSLSLTAVPEPAACCLIGLALTMGMCVRRRFPLRLEQVIRAGAIGGIALLGGVLAATTVHAGDECPPEVCGIFIDEFDGAEHDFTGGAVPAGGIWDGVWNETNGGDAGTPAFFVSNGEDFFGNPKPGVLFMEDLGLHPNTDGNFGVGWEGNKTSAPFLFRNVPAENNFVATIKINAQTNGQWSYAPIIARHAGPTPGQTQGDDLDPEESFITIGSFHTTAADNEDTPDIDETLNSSILTQNVINTAETEQNPFAGNGLPIWVRMTKQGGQFTPSFSLDGTTFTDQAPMVNPELNVPGEMLEVGPSYMTFAGGSGGELEIDFFEIEVSFSPPPLFSSWSPIASGLGSGPWDNANNWVSDVPGALPGVEGAERVHVTLGDVLPGPATIVANDAFTIPRMTIDSPNSYAVSGSGSIVLRPDAESITDPTLSRIDVLQGSHDIQVDLSIDPSAGNNNHIDVAAGAELNINNSFNLNGKQLLVSGDGRLNINNNTDAGTGTVIVAGGTVGGSGRVNGGLTNGNAANPGGTVSPGTSIGTLTVDGTYNQHSSSTLEIELGGTADGEFDVLAVNGLAILDGLVDVSLVNGFTPQIGDMFEFLTATNIVDVNVIELVPGDQAFYELMRSGNNYLLEVIMVPSGGVPGDYNNDGIVNAADYVLWRNGGPLANDPTAGVQPADYDFWKSRFGATSGSGSSLDSAAVPEPASMAMLLVALVLGGVLRRGRSAR